jgi:hypothetical protein
MSTVGDDNVKGKMSTVGDDNVKGKMSIVGDDNSHKFELQYADSPRPCRAIQPQARLCASSRDHLLRAGAPCENAVEEC